MKKIFLALLVMAFAATAASAGVGISWYTIYGAYTHDSPDVTSDPSAFQLLDSYSVTWQLLYAGANDVIDAVDLSNPGGGWVSGDDVVWATRTLPQSIADGNVTAPEDSTVWSDWMLNVSGDTIYEDLAWSTAGFSFQRVYEGSPAELSYFFESPLLALDTAYTGTPALPQLSALDSGSGGFQPDQQIPAVPEPATMALLGLGALTMAIRRRRK